jgi:thiamine pyrophosphate-dependent acetolactate synthase large subunit-like protein
LAVFKDQNTQLLEEFASLSQQLTEMQDEHAQLELHTQRLTGEPAALDSVTIEECERLETVLKAALQKIDAKKVGLVLLFVCQDILNCMNKVFPKCISPGSLPHDCFERAVSRRRR